VLGVAARGKSVAQARRAAYRAVDGIDFPAGFCRRDIGWREIARTKG
jgi:phosphoribosylamine--glycine ligase